MLVTTNLYLLLTFASEIQRRVDFMYTDERNILDVKGQSLIHALAPLFTIHRELKSKSVCKGVMWITYQQPVDNYKSAILCIYLATLYILTWYNRAFITKEPTK